MILIDIYGPPAAGKLTVANHLAKLTGYKVFHNHHTVDMLKEVIPYGKGCWAKTCQQIRLTVLEAAAKENIAGVIITHCYVNDDEDAPFMKRIQQLMKKYHGTIHYVRLAPTHAELRKRVKGESRKQHGKIKKLSTLKRELAEWDYYQNVPNVPTLVIDNSAIPAAKVAQQIKKHYKL